MPQCPECYSHNDDGAAFCSQCGENLVVRRRSRGSRRSLAWIVGAVLLGLLVLVLVVSSGTDTAPRGGGEGSSAVEVAVAPDGATDSGGELDRRVAGVVGGDLLTSEEDSDLRLLDRDEVTSTVGRALVVLELRDRNGRPWRQIRGVLVDSSGAVLCRYRPLLGAYSGVCRVPTSDEARVEIVGLSYRNEALDLALLRIRSSPAGYPWVSLLAEAPSDVLADGDALYVFSDYKAIPSAVAEAYHVGSDGVARLRLDADVKHPPETFVAVDAYGFVLGLCRLEENGVPLSDAPRSVPPDARWIVDPAGSLVLELDRPVGLSLEDLSDRLYAETFADFFLRADQAYKARRWQEAIDLFERALERVAFDEPQDAQVEDATRKLEKSYLEEVERLLSDSFTAEASALAESALARFDRNPTLWLLLGESRVLLSRFADAIAALVQSQDLQPGERVDSVLEEAYLRLASQAADSGDNSFLESALLEGLGRLPRSGPLLLELAKLYFDLEAWDDSSRLLNEVRRLDPKLRAAADDLLSQIDRSLKNRDAVVIPISSDVRSYRTDAVIDGAGTFTFIIDTGATYTTIPANVAAELGYDTSRAEQIRLSTAAGIITAPLLQVQSIDVQGYSVRNLKVVVLPQNVGPRQGLLGLNFLKHFKYTVDASRNEFRLEKP